VASGGGVGLEDGLVGDEVADVDVVDGVRIVGMEVVHLHLMTWAPRFSHLLPSPGRGVDSRF